MPNFTTTAIAVHNGAHFKVTRIVAAENESDACAEALAHLKVTLPQVPWDIKARACKDIASLAEEINKPRVVYALDLHAIGLKLSESAAGKHDRAAKLILYALSDSLRSAACLMRIMDDGPHVNTGIEVPL